MFIVTILSIAATNINEALLTAIDFLDQATREESLPEKSISMIILLTDGDPTVGKLGTEKLLLLFILVCTFEQ